MSRLALGTVQFGLDYGVANPGGRIALPMAKSIIAAATANGIDTYDTSPAYGTSEEVIGKLLPAGMKLVTKVPSIPKGSIGDPELDDCGKAFDRSLAALGTHSVYGLLAHSADDLLKDGSDRLFGWMRDLKAAGKAGRIGASVYTAEQIDGILAKFPIDLIQLPLNIVDQRLLRSGHLAKLKDRGVEIHVRSVFLQGLLLMEMGDLPAYFGPYRETIRGFHEHSDMVGLSPLELSLGFAMGIREVDRILVGVTSAAQLEEIVLASRSEVDARALANLSSGESGLLNPSLWKV